MPQTAIRTGERLDPFRDLGCAATRAGCRALRVVAFGGGTGLPVLLRGLRRTGIEQITAVVTVADDGGSSGRLREQLGVAPPGDLRRCLLALAERPRLAEVFDYRFDEGAELRDHSVGNLILAALADISGGMCEAVEQAGRFLQITGTVMTGPRKRASAAGTPPPSNDAIVRSAPSIASITPGAWASGSWVSRCTSPACCATLSARRSATTRSVLPRPSTAWPRRRAPRRINLGRSASLHIDRELAHHPSPFRTGQSATGARVSVRLA